MAIGIKLFDIPKRLNNNSINKENNNRIIPFSIIDTVYSGKSLLTFHWNILPPFSGPKRSPGRTNHSVTKGPNRVGVSPSPEDGNRSSFRNVVFFIFEII
jgi:hypothetical protein